MATNGPVPGPAHSPTNLHTLAKIVGQTWALNLVNRSGQDQMVFLALVAEGYSYDMAWEGMLASIESDD